MLGSTRHIVNKHILKHSKKKIKQLGNLQLIVSAQGDPSKYLHKKYILTKKIPNDKT